MKNIIKLSILTITIATFGVGCASSSMKNVRSLAVESSGFHKSWHCEPFANDLNAKLFEAGYETTKVGYRYKNNGRDMHHMVVLFRDVDGKIYVMDNEMNWPEEVAGDTDLALIRCFDRGSVCSMADVNDYSKDVPPTPVSELFTSKKDSKFVSATSPVSISQLNGPAAYSLRHPWTAGE